ncbi:class I SAM-dependent methyltransferase [Methanogenium cariaci]
MDQSFIFTIFEGLPRQGPGDDRCTKKAFERTGVKADANILDIGCGSGMQTIALAGLCRECRITAVDIYQPFLDVLNERAAKRNLLSRINIVPASMDELPFEKETFDLIWAEGSIFIIGIGNGISQWKNYLKPGGKIAFTDVVWFSKTPSRECVNFFEKTYPDMKKENDVCRILESEGYSNIQTFRLPDCAWWDDYYTPLMKRIPKLKKKYSGTEEEEMLDHILTEIEMFEKYPAEYGYTFFIAEKTARNCRNSQYKFIFWPGRNPLRNRNCIEDISTHGIPIYSGGNHPDVLFGDPCKLRNIIRTHPGKNPTI